MTPIARIISIAAVSAIALAGCSGMELSSAERSKPGGSAFSQGLYGGYLKLSREEFGESDFEDSDIFARRAKAAAGGEEMGPEDIGARKLPADKVGELSSARERLVRALDRGGRTGMPETAANAQVMFDCWMQEQEENFQPEDIARCRAEFMSQLARLEATPRPVAARPAPAPKGQKFVVYFPFDSDKLVGTAPQTISDAIDAAKKSGATRVYVSGHADRAGAGNYNLQLSERRAQAVVGALTGGGLSTRLVSFGSFGENVPAVSTRDGMRADRNRRVEIEIGN